MFQTDPAANSEDSAKVTCPDLILLYEGLVKVALHLQ